VADPDIKSFINGNISLIGSLKVLALNGRGSEFSRRLVEEGMSGRDVLEKTTNSEAKFFCVLYFRASKLNSGDKYLINSLAAGERYFPLLTSRPYWEKPDLLSTSDKSFMYNFFLSLSLC